MIDRKIEFFVAVVENGSFSSGAKKLLLSQSAISQQVALLEQELGAKLFDRNSYRPTLTKAGEFYYQKCKELISFYNEMNRQVRQINDHKLLRIGITGPFESHHVPFIVKMFKEEYPKIEIRFIKGSFQNCKDMLNNNEIDLAFAIENDFINEPKLAYQVLFSHQICAICSYEHPFATMTSIASTNLADKPLVCLSKKFGEGFYSDFVNAFNEDGIKPNIVKEVDSLDDLILSVKINEGIGLISREVVSEEDVAILDIINSHHRANYVIGYQKKMSNEYVKLFIDLTRKYFTRTL